MDRGLLTQDVADYGHKQKSKDDHTCFEVFLRTRNIDSVKINRNFKWLPNDGQIGHLSGIRINMICQRNASEIAEISKVSNPKDPSSAHILSYSRRTSRLLVLKCSFKHRCAAMRNPPRREQSPGDAEQRSDRQDEGVPHTVIQQSVFHLGSYEPGERTADFESSLTLRGSDLQSNAKSITTSTVLGGQTVYRTDDVPYVASLGNNNVAVPYTGSATLATPMDFVLNNQEPAQSQGIR